MIVTLKRGAAIEEINHLLETVFEISKGVNSYHYCEKLNLNKNALTIQNKLRDEWE